MNGRIYDPVLGRFLSADPNVDGTYDSQGYNRYSYVGNNPMNRTDPSGYRSLGDVFKQAFFLGPHILSDPMYWASPKTFNQYYGQAAGIGVTAVVSYFCGPVVGGAAGGFVSGFSSSLLNGGSVGDAFKSGVIGGGIGAVMGAVTAGIGEAFGPVGSNIGRELGRAAAHGVVGGLFAEAMGGDFRHGFLAGFAGSIGGSLAPNIPGVPGYGDRSFSAIALRTTIAAVVGGTASVLGGGKFANGAVTAAFQHLLNAEGLRPKASHAGWFQRKFQHIMLSLGGDRAPLAHKLLDRYMSGEGGTYTLSKTDVNAVDAVSGTAGPFTPAQDPAIMDRLVRGEVIAIDYQDPSIAQTPGTLGQFSTEYRGNLSYIDGHMQFDGDMIYHDSYDFMQDSASQSRTSWGNFCTWYGRNFITGSQFNVESEPIQIHSKL
jgi:hypothetical protein